MHTVYNYIMTTLAGGEYREVCYRKQDGEVLHYIATLNGVVDHIRREYKPGVNNFVQAKDAVSGKLIAAVGFDGIIRDAAGERIGKL